MNNTDRQPMGIQMEEMAAWHQQDFLLHFTTCYWIGNKFQNCKESNSMNKEDHQPTAIQMEEMIAW